MLSRYLTGNAKGVAALETDAVESRLHWNGLLRLCVPVSLRSLQTGIVNVKRRLIQRLMLPLSAVRKISLLFDLRNLTPG